MFMQNFSSQASSQTDLDTFLTIFEENFRIFQENSKREFQILVFNFILNLVQHIHAKLYPDGLRHIFDLFSRKIQNFLKENLEFSKSEKNSDRDFQKKTRTYHQRPCG
jgi:hypothetical protein